MNCIGTLGVKVITFSVHEIRCTQWLVHNDTSNSVIPLNSRSTVSYS